MDLTATHCRLGRVLLRWSQDDLAAASLVGIASVKRFERGASIRPVLVAAMRKAMEERGVVFLIPGTMVQGVKVGIGAVRPETEMRSG